MQEYQVKVRNEAIKTTSTHFLNAFISEFFAKCFFLPRANYPAGNYMFKINNRHTRARCVKYVLYC